MTSVAVVYAVSWVVLGKLGAVVLGFAFELLVGWPNFLWHPICGIGWLIAKGERLLRSLFPTSPKGERVAGVLLAIFVPLLCFAFSGGLLYFAWQTHYVLGFALETLCCYSIFATRSLKDAAVAVAHALEQDLDAGRKAVGMIVGRDTGALSEEGVIKATVETVAENLADGIVAPLCYTLLGGAPLGYLYKAVNTLDSMVGYKNDKYRYFGTASAKLDDVLNYLPARLSALLMVGTCPLVGLDGKNAWRIFRRDRKNHSSPNSAQTESVMAGALHVQLAGNANYFGKVYEKPYIGDADRPIERADICKACKLLVATCVVAVVLGVMVAGLV